MTDKTLLHTEVARKGGISTLNKHGKSHYSTMGKLGAKGRITKYGKEYYQKLSKAGVEGRRKKKQDETNR